MHTITYTDADIAAREEELKQEEEKKIRNIFDDVLKGDDLVEVGLRYRLPPSRIKRMFLSKAKKEKKRCEVEVERLENYYTNIINRESVLRITR